MQELVTIFNTFYTEELSVQSFRVNVSQTIEIPTNHNDYNYHIFCSEAGIFRVFCQGKVFELNKGDIFISMPFESFYIVYVDSNSKLDTKPILTKIAFASNIFNNIVGDADYLRSFNKRKKGENCFYSAKDFSEKLTPYDIICFLKRCINHNYGLVHFSSAVGVIISSLDMAFDKKQGNLAIATSDEYDVKIWDYILNNCVSKLTAKTVEKKFNVSKWYLDKVTNRFYNMPFHKTVNSLRMWRAKSLMRDNVPLSKIASLCGFANYTSFYRSYVNFFNISPKEDYMYYKNNAVFYSDNKNKESEEHSFEQNV